MCGAGDSGSMQTAPLAPVRRAVEDQENQDAAPTLRRERGPPRPAAECNLPPPFFANWSLVHLSCAVPWWAGAGRTPIPQEVRQAAGSAIAAAVSPTPPGVCAKLRCMELWGQRRPRPGETAPTIHHTSPPAVSSKTRPAGTAPPRHTRTKARPAPAYAAAAVQAVATCCAGKNWARAGHAVWWQPQLAAPALDMLQLRSQCASQLSRHRIPRSAALPQPLSCMARSLDRRSVMPKHQAPRRVRD
jgi:hypothetical protein